MVKVFAIAQETGHITLPDRKMLVDLRELNRLPDHEVVIICTGSQGEPMAALTRIANGNHREVEIHPGDTVIFSSSPIPGNTKQVYKSIDQLFRAGANVVHNTTIDIHASGHGNQEDLKLMLSLMKPKFFIPIHGEYRMLVQHARIAAQTGIPQENINILDNGQVLHISRDRMQLGSKSKAGNVYIHGSTLGSLKGNVMDERIQLSKGGIIIIVAIVDLKAKKILSGPNLISRGFVYVRESEAFINDTTSAVKNILNKVMNKSAQLDGAALQQLVKTKLEEHVSRSLERKPVIIPYIKEIAPPQSK